MLNLRENVDILSFLILHYKHNILYWQIHFTMQNPLGLPSIDNGAHGTKKLLLNTQESKDFT